MEMPKGCSKSVQISYIEDKSLRPQEDYMWLVTTMTKGITVTTVRPTFDEALDVAKEHI